MSKDTQDLIIDQLIPRNTKDEAIRILSEKGTSLSKTLAVLLAVADNKNTFKIFSVWVKQYVIDRDIREMLIKSCAEHSKDSDIMMHSRVVRRNIMKHGGTFDRALAAVIHSTEVNNIRVIREVWKEKWDTFLHWDNSIYDHTRGKE